jgi:hypothetical protein
MKLERLSPDLSKEIQGTNNNNNLQSKVLDLQRQQLNEIKMALEEMIKDRNTIREKLIEMANERLEELTIEDQLRRIKKESSNESLIMEPSLPVKPQAGSSIKPVTPRPLGWRGSFHQTPPYHSPPPPKSRPQTPL